MNDEKIRPVFDDRPLHNDLHMDLMNVINNPKYLKLRMAEVVGVLEFLKFNLINASET